MSRVEHCFASPFLNHSTGALFSTFSYDPNHSSHCGYCYQIQHILISSSLIERRYCDSVDSNDSNIDIEIDIAGKLLGICANGSFS